MVGSVLDAGDYQVLVDRRGRARYAVETVVAWIIGLVSLDPTAGEIPTKRYVLTVRRKADGKSLWQEPAAEPSVLSDAREMADQIRRMDIQDFIYKKQHGWRID